MRWGVVAVVLLAGASVASAAGGAGRETASTCNLRNMTLKLGNLVSETTEQETLPLTLSNQAQSSCVLDGYPSIRLFDRRGRVLAFRYAHRGDQMITSARPRPVRLRPGASAFFALNENSCEGSHRGTARSLAISQSGPPEARGIRLRHYPILDYCGPGFFSRVTVSPFEQRPNGWACVSQGPCHRRRK
jgi:hypothetical protein